MNRSAPPTCWPVRRLVFDLDGTLVDSASDLTAALNHVLSRLGRPTLSRQTVRHLVGRGARILIEQGLSLTGGTHGAPPIEALLPDFLDYYTRHIADDTQLFPGTVDMLDWAEEAGMVLAVCTNKPQALSEMLLDELGVRQRFATVIGGDALPERKPHRIHLDTVLDAMGDGPALLLGDTVTDVAAARNSGVPVGLVAFGFSPVPAQELSADFILHDMAALPRHIRPA
ncbi:MAG: HAD-IA family hydrolase [Rhodothalassiaceae bacterium]